MPKRRRRAYKFSIHLRSVPRPAAIRQPVAVIIPLGVPITKSPPAAFLQAIERCCDVAHITTAAAGFSNRKSKQSKLRKNHSDWFGRNRKNLNSSPSQRAGIFLTSAVVVDGGRVARL
jgi:hypothetical protein